MCYCATVVVRACGEHTWLLLSIERRRLFGWGWGRVTPFFCARCAANFPRLLQPVEQGEHGSTYTRGNAHGIVSGSLSSPQALAAQAKAPAVERCDREGDVGRLLRFETLRSGNASQSHPLNRVRLPRFYWSRIRSRSFISAPTRPPITAAIYAYTVAILRNLAGPVKAEFWEHMAAGA